MAAAAAAAVLPFVGGATQARPRYVFIQRRRLVHVAAAQAAELCVCVRRGRLQDLCMPLNGRIRERCTRCSVSSCADRDHQSQTVGFFPSLPPSPSPTGPSMLSSVLESHQTHQQHTYAVVWCHVDLNFQTQTRRPHIDCFFFLLQIFILFCSFPTIFLSVTFPQTNGFEIILKTIVCGSFVW